MKIDVKETQECTRCGETKPLSAYRRQNQRPNGRDTICKACQKVAYDAVKERSFGPLPKLAGSDEWLKEV